MAQQNYVPNPNFYAEQIKEQENLLKEFDTASYDSTKRGYTVDGKFYTAAQLKKAKSDVVKKITNLKTEERKNGKYGPEFGKGAKPNDAGIEYEKLRKAAVDIKVTDFASAMANLKAWKAVQDFVAANPDIQIVKNVNALLPVEGRRGNTRGTILKTVPIGAGSDDKFFQGAIELATKFAETGTTKLERIQTYGKPGANNAAYKNVKTVTNQELLDTRLSEIDSVKSTTYAPAVEQTATARGGQSSMNEQQTMAAFAGLSNVNKPKAKTPSKPGAPGKPGASGTGTTVVVDGKKVKVGSEQWKTIIQQEFGSMWDVYNSNPDVKAVIDKSVKEGWFNDELKLTASLQNTGWYRTTQQSARQFAVQQSTDPANTEARINSNVESIRAESLSQGFTLNDPTLRKLATDQLKFGWSDQQRFNAIGSEVVAQSQLGGGQGMADLRQSSIGRNLRSKAATYFQKPTEDMIGTWTQQILTGQKSEVQWDELMRSSARTQFRSLQPALDRGEDVDTAMYAYKQQALATLGSSIDATQIDWTQDKWNKALNFRDTKTNEFRQMDLWEWNKYLRTLPEWQNTDEAKIAYGNLSQSLARGFGKTA